MKKIIVLCMSFILLSVAGCTLQKGNSDLSNNHESVSSPSETAQKNSIENSFSTSETEQNTTQAVLEPEFEMRKYSLWRSEDNAIEFSLVEDREWIDRLGFDGIYKFGEKTYEIDVTFFHSSYEENNKDFQSDGGVVICNYPPIEGKINIIDGDYYLDSENGLLVVKQSRFPSITETEDFAKKYKEGELIRFHRVESDTRLYLPYEYYYYY